MIVFCHVLSDHSGSPVVLREAIRALSSSCEGSNALFVGNERRGLLDSAPVTLHRYWFRSSRRGFIGLPSLFFSQFLLYRALSRLSPPPDSIIYVNTMLPFGAALWGRRHGRKVVYHSHEISIPPEALSRFLVRVARRTADLVLYVSREHARRLPIEGVSSAVLPNPVTTRITQRGSATPYAPRRSGRFEVLMLATPIGFKGVPEFLSLARRFEGRSDFVFRLVLNADESEVSRFLRKKKTPGNIEVHPRTDHPECFYATADVLVSLSRIDLVVETFGLTIAEGMSFGLPVIVPPVGGPAEIVTDGKEGYLVDSRDAKRLDEKLLALAEDPQAALVMSEAARCRARDFDFNAFAEALRAHINGVKTTKAFGRKQQAG